MNEKSRLIYYFILGSFGGVTGWILNAMLFHGSSQSLRVLIVGGGIIGAAIGLSLALYEWLSTGSLIRLIKFGAKGMVIGACAGAFALPLTQLVYAALLRKVASGQAAGTTILLTFLVGLVCWLIFGSIIGTVEGLCYTGTQIWKGCLGGLLGGLVGGSFYEINRIYNASADTFASQFWQAISLMAVGGSIGAAVALIATVTRKAWVKILDGKLSNKEIDVTKYVDRVLGKQKQGIIGADQYAANVYLPADNGILPKHAFLSYTDEVPTLTASPEALKLKAVTTVNGRAIKRSPISNGDKIRIGATNLVYYQKKR